MRAARAGTGWATPVTALTRAWRWQKLIDEGIYTSLSEIGDAENVSKSCVGRILRLALLGAAQQASSSETCLLGAG